MAQPQPPPPPRPPFPVLAAFLSYLVPGLGQFCQGRYGKGLLFFFCLYTLFFYGQYLGHWSNVYLPKTVEEGVQTTFPKPLVDLYSRLPFAGQFWIGVAAWPALYQYTNYDPRGEQLWGFQWAPYESRALEGAGSRNVAPFEWTGKTLNELQINGDKTWDLAWVFTVIAGVLNILVIYDAFAGPAFVETETKRQPLPEAAA